MVDEKTKKPKQEVQPSSPTVSSVVRELRLDAIWNSVLLITIITLLITTREELSAMMTKMESWDKTIQKIEARLQGMSTDMTDLQVRVKILEEKERTHDKKNGNE
ncbi:MAG: hypothetical protein BV459_00280 [Thermoplasmata archaeon M11B2D]|nr:MAG: hypothetical protein BV459_00280 [Thermoplasmata archaeon M11B2D]